MSEVHDRKSKSKDKDEDSVASQKVSLGKNLDLEEETLMYFPQQLGKLNLEEELGKLQEKYSEKTKGRDAIMYNYQNFGVNYPVNVGFRTTSMDYGFFPPNKSTICKKFFPKTGLFTKINAQGQQKGPSSLMNL